VIYIVEESGFCHGVRAAVHKADGLVEKLASGSKVYLYGDLVNNRHVMARYIHEGFIVAESADEIDAGSVVIIRAHGVGRAIYEELAKKNINIVDCTCVKVKSIHKIVAEKCAAGYRVIIVGKKNHPEVLGTFGWCNDGVVVEAMDELEAAISNSKVPLCVVAQTTCNKSWWDKAIEIIKAKKPDAEIFNTLCDVTAKRIENAVEMAKESDCMVVVGDKKSANSVELFEACKAVCKNVFFVSSLEELSENTDDILRCEKIGIAGSSSAPTGTIKEIHDFLLFAEFLTKAKKEVETACDKYLNDLIDDAKDKPFIGAAIRDLHNQNQGGKRIRGAMIKLGEKIASGIDEENCGGTPSTTVAMAYEIFQTAILIHDDVIDKSCTRRGKQTIHTCEGDSHFGISRAICIGDYGLFLANKILADSGLPDDVLVKVFRMFSEIQLKTIEGEIMDVSLPAFPIDILKEYDEYMQLVGNIYDNKTSWYTLVGPLLLGAICGGWGIKQTIALRDFAMPLGMAFQIKDDLLGIFANEKVLGKPALSDIVEKKQTILYGYAYKHAASGQKLQLEKSYGNPLANENDLQIVREIFMATGAKAYAEDKIFRLSQLSLIISNNFNDEIRPLMQGLVHYLLTRRY